MLYNQHALLTVSVVIVFIFKVEMILNPYLIELYISMNFLITKIKNSLTMQN